MNVLKPHHNYRSALAKLKEFIAIEIVTERDRAGVIQAFEFTFEQCWKAFQKIAVQEGFEARSPKQSLQRALEMRLIEQKDEEDWIMMLKDRNSTSHMYREEIACAICERIVGTYVNLLSNVEKRMDTTE